MLAQSIWYVGIIDIVFKMFGTLVRDGTVWCPYTHSMGGKFKAARQVFTRAPPRMIVIWVANLNKGV